MANIVYTTFLYKVGSGTIDFITDPIYAMLVSGSYVPNTGHNTLGSILPYQTRELGAGTDYKSGGALLTSKTLTDSAGTMIFDAADVTFNNSTLTASGVVIYWSGGVENRVPIEFIDIGNQSSTNGTFQIVWNNSNGILRWNVS